MTPQERTLAYMNALRQPYQKICRLRFLQPDGSIAFSLDNSSSNPYSATFISDGSIQCNLQNGKRRNATVTLSNVDSRYDYNVNNLWFGTEIALDEGLILQDGSDYYIQQGIFVSESPVEIVRPKEKTVTLNLVDKWANLDGTLFGKLEGTYEVSEGTNIYTPIQSLLSQDRGNGTKIDNKPPVFTEYYNNMTQTMPDGSTVSMVNAPYDLRIDGDSGSIADIVLGLAGMVNAWVGYDQTGSLRIDPSQDDILDTDKPVLWQFSMDETTLLGAEYTVKNTEVYNDYIVVGEQLDDYSQPGGRATNYDPNSDTNVNSIGRKTIRESASGFSTTTQCKDLAVWKLKRATILQRAVSISCKQIFHIYENALCTIIRTDKPGNPVERHLITGFSRPLAGNKEMTISAVSVNDMPIATVSDWPT